MVWIDFHFAAKASDVNVEGLFVPVEGISPEPGEKLLAGLPDTRIEHEEFQ
jgi:hypothetical protein